MAKGRGMRGIDGSRVSTTRVVKTRSFVRVHGKAQRPDPTGNVFPVEYVLPDLDGMTPVRSVPAHVLNRRAAQAIIAAAAAVIGATCRLCGTQDGYCLCESELAWDKHLSAQRLESNAEGL